MAEAMIEDVVVRLLRTRDLVRRELAALFNREAMDPGELVAVLRLLHEVHDALYQLGARSVEGPALTEFLVMCSLADPALVQLGVDMEAGT
jgi:predicted component of type VI protein secretion system